MNKRVQRPTKGQQTGATKTRVPGIIAKARRFDYLWDSWDKSETTQEEIRRLAVELGRLDPTRRDPEYWARELKKVATEKATPGRKPSEKSVKASKTYARQKKTKAKPSRVRNLK